MNRETIAVLAQEGGKFFTQLLMLYPPKRQPPAPIAEPTISQEIVEEQESVPEPPSQIPDESKATGIEAGCIPCALGHTGTCSGLLNEAIRFANKDGMASLEVIDRVNMCLDELNAMERVDLRPEMVVHLPGWEKDLANEILVRSRKTRHELEGLASPAAAVGDLERVAADLQTARNDLGRQWFQHRLVEK